MFDWLRNFFTVIQLNFSVEHILFFLKMNKSIFITSYIHKVVHKLYQQTLVHNSKKNTLSSKTIILLKNICTKPILVNLGKPVGKTFEIKCINPVETSQMIFSLNC